MTPQLRGAGVPAPKMLPIRLLTRLDRHLCGAMLTAAAVVLLALLGLMAVFTLLEELQEGGSGYGFAEALWYVVLTLPRGIYETLPHVLFLGALIGLGRLAADSELVAMRAAGLSAYRMLGGLAWAVGLAWLLGAWLGEWAAPGSEALAEAHKAGVRQGAGGRSTAAGHWHREGRLYMHVQALDANGDLLGVRQYWLDDSGALSLTREAARATYQRPPADGERGHWRLLDGADIRTHNGQTEVTEFAEQPWPGQIDPELLGERVLMDVRRLSISDLLRQIRHLKREGVNATTQRISLWSKCLQPAAIFGLVMLALAFVLGPLRDVGIAVRITAGIIVGLCFKYLQDLFAPMAAVYDLAPAIAMGAPIALCWAAAIWGLRRTA